MKKVLIINGPNLNLLGTRETNIYGEDTLDSIIAEVKENAKKIGIEVEGYQSNHEGAIIDKIHSARGEFDGIVINAGAYSHYSIAIHDAIKAVCLPCVEVHMSNIYAREEYRHKSVISPACAGVICGLGKQGYMLAVEALSKF